MRSTPGAGRQLAAPDQDRAERAEPTYPLASQMGWQAELRRRRAQLLYMSLMLMARI